MTRIIKNCIGEKEKDGFYLGMDYLISKDSGKPYFLEYNLYNEFPSLGRKFEKYFPRVPSPEFESPLNAFFQIYQNKILQHELFESLMPDYALLKNGEAEAFVKRNPEVIYKKASLTSRGAHVEFKPTDEWGKDLDFVEEFIHPTTQEIEGKHYPYVFRDWVFLEAKEGNIEWDSLLTYRKQGKSSIEDNDTNKKFKFVLNTSGFIRSETSAERVDALPEEIDLIRSTTDNAIRRAIESASNYDWNATKMTDHALIGCFMFTEYKEIKDLFGKKEINTLLIPIESGRIWSLVRNLADSLDGLVLNLEYTERSYHGGMGMSTYFNLEKENGSIVRYHKRGGKKDFAGSRKSKENIFIGSEEGSEEKMITKYLENRKK